MSLNIYKHDIMLVILAGKAQSSHRVNFIYSRLDWTDERADDVSGLGVWPTLYVNDG